jgi:hypothetical protein
MTRGRRARRWCFSAGGVLAISCLAVSPATVRADTEAAALPSSFACPATIVGETLLKDASLHNDSEVAAAGIYMPPGFRQLDCAYAIPNNANQGIRFNVQYFAQGDPHIGSDGICEKTYSAGGPVDGDTTLYFNSFLAGFDTVGDFYSTTKISWTSFTAPGNDPAVVDPVQQLTKEWFLESLAFAGDCPGAAGSVPANQPATPNPTHLPSAAPAGSPFVAAGGTGGPNAAELSIACAIILLLLGGGTGVGVHQHSKRRRRAATGATAPNYIAGEFITDFIRDEVSEGTYVPPRDHFASASISNPPAPAEPPAPPPVVPLDFSPQLVQSLLAKYVGPDRRLRVPSTAPPIAQFLDGFTMSDPVYAADSVSVALTDPMGITETQVQMHLQAEAGKAVVKISLEGALPLPPDAARDFLQHLLDQRLGDKRVVGTAIDATGVHVRLAG